MPYWFSATLAALPAVLWMIGGLGIPYALAALPRKDWHETPLVLMTALAFGPALLTTWMFVLGTLGGIDETPLLTLSNILIGTGILAVIGVILAARKWRSPAPRPKHFPLAFDERLIVLLTIAALVLRWLTTSYWNFVDYDPLWVYGYQGRLYTLLGYIPTHIGYYPQFLQLQYTYAQLAAASASGVLIDDHAARAVVPFLHWGSVLAAYVLGKRLFNRRVGIFLMGLWALYPHVGQWATVGDLEIPLTFAFTGAAAFFLSAWLETQHQRLHNAALAGLFLSIALWTKPTGGAFILGVGLVMAVYIAQIVLSRTGEIVPRLQIVLVTGLTALPLGGLWYVRNLLYDLPPITLPNPFWLTQALRSGAEFSWIMLALIVLLLYLFFAPLRIRPNRPALLIGFTLIVAAVIPTILVPYTAFNVPNRMDTPEWLLLIAGAIIISLTLWRYAAHHLTLSGRWDAIKVGWALLLALPYFVTWFYSYSYHYRLSFPIVPLLALPTAVLLARWTAQALRFKAARTAYGLAVLVIALPGVFGTLHHVTGGWDMLWSNEFPDDFAKLESTNLALAWTVRGLQADMGDRRSVIVAPGLQRLPFFFPLDDVRIDAAPTDLDELTGVDYYLYSQEAAWFYPENKLPLQNQVTGSMSRQNALAAYGGAYSDSSFFARIFKVANPNRRFRPPRNLNPPTANVQFGGFAELVSVRLNDIPDDSLPHYLQLVWKALKPTKRDYRVYVHLLDSTGTFITTWDAPPAQNEFTYYATNLWDTGEYIFDERWLPLPENIAPGEYRLRVGFYDLGTQERVTSEVDGREEDGYTLTQTIQVTP